LITLSTRAQVESKKADTNTLQAVKRIIEREGIAGLYAGLESALFGITVTNFVYYYCMHLIASTSLRRSLMILRV
jgi:adenine nucleotide transporter 17